MKVGFSNRNFDTVMVMDAILISLACVLIILAYREITQAPIRHARDLAHAVLTVTDDFSTDDALSSSAFDENGTVQLEKRFQDTLVQIRAFEPGANVQLYSDHPLLVPLSVPADSFLSNALEGFRAAEANVVEAIAQTPSGRMMRLAAPLLAFRDCKRCEAAGMPSYKSGELVGVREIVVPVGDYYAETIKKLLYACGLLASALMVFLGLIIPVFKRNRQESMKISDLANSFEKQAVTDPLTGLHNRRHFETALEEYLKKYNAAEKPVGLLLLDLDHFKQINDNHGHDWGDVVLKEVASRLADVTRSSDVVARIGGEEFAVITPNANNAQILGVAERYRSTIEALAIDIGSVVLRPTISIGGATNSDRPQSADELYRAADQKLYEAKRAGRNRVAA